ncbi:MAG: hypothetical protein H0U59_00800, partial [Gemmatimonadaceae bacterium]|nr:hypothetical protein [Gemmatimonadaceae bacterium]
MAGWYTSRMRRRAGGLLVLAILASTLALVQQSVSKPAVAASPPRRSFLAAIPSVYDVEVDFDNHDGTAINDSAQFVGDRVMTTSSDWSPFVWDPQTGMRDLELPGAGYYISKALGINASGAVTGWSATTSDISRPVRWSAGGSITILPTPADSTNAHSLRINDAGVSVGYSRGNSRWNALKWEAAPSTRVVDVTPPGAIGARARDINNAGQIVGDFSNSLEDPMRAFFRDESGVTHVLPSLDGDRTTEAYAINNANPPRIVGHSKPFAHTGDPRAVRWDLVGGSWQVTDLSALTRYGAWAAYDVNDSGEIVGNAATRVYEQREGIFWPSSGGPILLPGPASAINNASDIIYSAYAMTGGETSWRRPFVSTTRDFSALR